MQTTIGDRRISYDSSGQGVPLLLMHAFPLNRAMYAEQHEGLAHVARVISFDVPGAGGSEPGPLSIDGMAEIAAGILDALQIDRAVVGGVSMGGYAAFAFARLFPDRLRGLVFANTRSAADSEEARAGRHDVAAAARAEGGPAEIASRMLDKVLGETARKKNKKLVARVREMIEATPGETIARLSEALAERADSASVLSAIAVPTLVIAAEEDSITPTAEMRAFAEQIPGVDMLELVRCGHLSNMEAPEAFNLGVEQFLARV